MPAAGSGRLEPIPWDGIGWIFCLCHWPVGATLPWVQPRGRRSAVPLRDVGLMWDWWDWWMSATRMGLMQGLLQYTLMPSRCCAHLPTGFVVRVMSVGRSGGWGLTCATGHVCHWPVGATSPVQRSAVDCKHKLSLPRVHVSSPVPRQLHRPPPLGLDAFTASSASGAPPRTQQQQPL